MEFVKYSKHNELVSAVITTCNRLNLLKRAIDGVLQQTYKNIEIIVVDDGSKDGTKEWCESQNLIYVRNEESRGGNYSRNRGIKLAHGKYIAFLDDDDVWKHDKIECQVNALEKSGHKFVYCGRTLEILDEKGNIKLVDDIPNKKYSGNLSRKVLYSIFCTTSTIMARRDELINIGCFDEDLKFWQEYEMTIRFAQKNEIDYVAKPLTIYRIDKKDKNRLTNKFFDWEKVVCQIQEKHKDLYESLDFFEKIRTKFLVYNDGIVRARTSGLKVKAFILRLNAIILLPVLVIENLVDKVHK